MDFDLGRLRRAEQVIGGGAIALFISVFFFKWYGVSTNVPSIAGLNLNVSRTGWETFTNSRWVWLITMLAALAAVALVATRRTPELPFSPGVIVTGLGALSTLLILYRIIHHPTASASFGSYHASAGIKLGIWLGLIASIAITYGGLLEMQGAATPAHAVPEEPADPFTGLTVDPAARATPASAAPAATPASGAPAATPASGAPAATPASGAPAATPPSGEPAATPAPPIPDPVPPPGETGTPPAPAAGA
jgi:hypothetical protein